MKHIATLRVPATSANLGPGFDAMGMALALWNTFDLYADSSVDSIVVDTNGEGAGIHPTGKRHLVASILLDEYPQARQLRIVCRNLVPSGSGLGSSSTATLAGVLLAACLRAGAPGAQPDARAMQTALARAVAIEGHGDNVAPALLGGLVLVAEDGPCLIARQVPIAPLTVAVCVPEVHFLTEHARAALPAVYSRADAVFNIARGALVVEALRHRRSGHCSGR